MTKKIFTIGDIEIFISADSVEEAYEKFYDALATIDEFGEESIYEIEGEIEKIDTTKMN